jgi:hypothetical protein
MGKASKARKENQKAAEQMKAHLMQEKALRERLHWLQETQPEMWSRISILSLMQQLQRERGGHFEKGLVFVHTAMFPFNIRRIGVIDPFRLIVTFEVWDHEAIRQGITWVPIDQVVWAGSTDWELDGMTMGFETKDLPPGVPVDTRRLSGLA